MTNEANTANAAATANTASAERDVNYAEFDVPCQAKPETDTHVEIGGDVFNVSVVRVKRGDYAASCEAFETESGAPAMASAKSAQAVVNKILIALGLNVKSISHAANEVEQEAAAMAKKGDGANESEEDENYFFDDLNSEGAKAAQAAAEKVIAAEAMLGQAGKATREGWIAFGSAYNEAAAVFTKYAPEGESGNAAWGAWLKKAFAHSPEAMARLESKNAKNQAGFMAKATEAVLDAIDVNTASTFEKNVNAMLRGFATDVAVKIIEQEGDDHLSYVLETKLVKAALADIASGNKRSAERLAAYQDEAAKAAKKGKPVKPLSAEDVKLMNACTVLSWLFDCVDAVEPVTVDATIMGALENHLGGKARKAMAKAAEEVLARPTEEEEKSAKAESAAKAASAAFADLTIDEAAKHLLAILVAHGEAEEVLSGVEVGFKAWQIKAEADAKTKAEAEENAEA